MMYQWDKLEESKPMISEVWEDIKTKFQMLLESSQLKWLDDRARENALEKLHSVKLFVASYQEINLIERYSQLAIIDKDYLGNLQSLKTFKANATRNLLNTAPSFLNSSLNMGSAIYSAIGSYPKVIHLSRLGFTLGHELIHGFTGSGRMFLSEWANIGVALTKTQKVNMKNDVNAFTINIQIILSEVSLYLKRRMLPILKVYFWIIQPKCLA